MMIIYNLNNNVLTVEEVRHVFAWLVALVVVAVLGCVVRMIPCSWHHVVEQPLKLSPSMLWSQVSSHYS